MLKDKPMVWMMETRLEMTLGMLLVFHLMVKVFVSSQTYFLILFEIDVSFVNLRVLGNHVGINDGTNDGLMVGDSVDKEVGNVVGTNVGDLEGDCEGLLGNVPNIKCFITTFHDVL